MKRREILGVIGGLTSGLTGCLATGVSNQPADSTTTPRTPRETPPVNTGGLSEFDPGDTYQHIDIGTRDGVPEKFKPHTLLVWNALERETQVFIRILDRVAATTAHRDEYKIPTDQTLRVTLLAPSRYYLQLWGTAIESPETLLVPCSLFDCNSSVTRIGVFENGDVRSSVMSTAAACPSPDC